MGRVHRLGQTEETWVHRYIVSDTVEEAVYRLARRIRRAHSKKFGTYEEEEEDINGEGSEDAEAPDAEEFNDTNIVVSGRGDQASDKDYQSILFEDARRSDYFDVKFNPLLNQKKRGKNAIGDEANPPSVVESLEYSPSSNNPSIGKIHAMRSAKKRKL
jgi:hypothetical protein